MRSQVSQPRQATRYAWAASLGCALFTLAVAMVNAEPSHSWGDPCRADDPTRAAAIHSLYDQAQVDRIWLTDGGMTRAGRGLVRLLARTGEAVTTVCLERALAKGNGDGSGGDLEIMLTDAYLALREHQTGSDVDADDHLAALAAGAANGLQAGVDATADGLGRADAASPPPRTTAAMQVARARYRWIADHGGWPTLGAGPPIEPGDRDPRVPALHKRLAATGDVSARAAKRPREVYWGPLVRALEAFQARHGLEPDGVVDAATRRALDVSPRRRARQVALNLGRMTERAIDARGPLVRVNIPAFRATLREEGRVTFSTRAIVGRREHPTPQLDTRIEAITLNPAWYAPPRVVREELAPVLARDIDYAERNGFETIDSERSISEIDWARAPAVTLRQAPGPGNELGRVKFEMPNPRRIYLHDTPKKHLFESPRRTFSAGCVRIEEPMALAARLTGVEAQRIDAMAASGETRTMRFGWRVPVQLVYFTAWVDAEGRVQFRRDVYGKDDL